MDKQKCGDCVFFDREYKHWNGKCVRHAPTLDRRNPTNLIFPQVDEDFWCGDYKRRSDDEI